MKDITSVINIILYVVGIGIITWMMNSLTKKIDRIDELDKRVSKLEWLEEYLNNKHREK